MNLLILLIPILLIIGRLTRSKIGAFIKWIKNLIKFDKHLMKLINLDLFN